MPCPFDPAAGRRRRDRWPRPQQRAKLADALDPTSEVPVSKVCGFVQILAITLGDIDYLEGAIYTGAVRVPVSHVRDTADLGWRGL